MIDEIRRRSYSGCRRARRTAPVSACIVIFEGNSFLEYIRADLAITGKIKPSARRTLSKSDFLYLSSLDATTDEAKRQFEEFCAATK